VELAALGVALCSPAASSVPLDPTSSSASAPASPAPAPATPGAAYQPVVVSGIPLPQFTAEIAAGTVADPALCAAAPIVSGYDYAGTPFTIDATTGGPTLVVLLAHWCPECAREIPVINAWRDSGGVPAELQVVGLSTGILPDRENFPPDAWLTRVGWVGPLVADDQQNTALNAYGGISFPTMVFVGSDGLVRWRITGEYTAEEIQARVDAAVPSSTVPAAAGTTQPPTTVAQAQTTIAPGEPTFTQPQTTVTLAQTTVAPTG
jgi:thiol-disulfide isomerase/thioredoxin